MKHNLTILNTWFSKSISIVYVLDPSRSHTIIIYRVGIYRFYIYRSQFSPEFNLGIGFNITNDLIDCIYNI